VPGDTGTYVKAEDNERDEEEKLTREGTNISLLASELTSEPEIETISEPTTRSPPRSNPNAKPTTNTSSTTNSLNTTDNNRQHFVTTDIFEPSIDSVDMGTEVSERVVQ
jgi:hypothetical protein